MSEEVKSKRSYKRLSATQRYYIYKTIEENGILYCNKTYKEISKDVRSHLEFSVSDHAIKHALKDLKVDYVVRRPNPSVRETRLAIKILAMSLAEVYTEMNVTIPQQVSKVIEKFT